MLEEIKVATALRRLAILESQPLRSPQDLLEWDVLRKWVLNDPELLRQYREQEYFSQMEEVTKTNLLRKILSHFFQIFELSFPTIKLDRVSFRDNIIMRREP